MLGSLLILALSSVASAHFRLTYPYWRGDAFEEPASEWIWPCAGIDQTISDTNRTSWPIDGGSLVFVGSHPWAYTYVNLGLGNNVTSFNVTLVEGFNQTGNGTFCFPKLSEGLSALDLKEGSNASIQVIQISHSGSALYNCADITFTSTAKVLDAADCKNATGVGGAELENAGTSSSGNATSSGTAASASSTGAAGSNNVKVGIVVSALAVGVGALLL